MAVPVDIAERRARLASGSGAMAERRRALFGAPSSDTSTAASLGALFKRFGEELMAQAVVQPAPQAPTPLAPVVPPPEPEPVVPVQAARPEGQPKFWTIEARSLDGTGMRRAKITPTSNGEFLVESRDRYGNPRRATLRADFGQSTLKAIDD